MNARTTIRTVALTAMAAGLATTLTALPAGAAQTRSDHDRAGLTSTGSLSTMAAPKARTVSTNAAVGFAVTDAKCWADGITFTAETYENGLSGVQQFRQQAKLQEFTTRGWVTISGTSKVLSTKFANDSRNFTFSRDWTATHDVNGASHRVIWQGFYLNGTGKAIFKTKQIKVNCL